MFVRHKSRSRASFVDTPKGIFTAQGHWFSVREVDLRSYCGELLGRVSLDELFEKVHLWIQLPSVGAILALCFGTYFVGALWGIVASLFTFWGLYYLRSALVLPLLEPVISLFNRDMVLILIAVFSFSPLGRDEDYLALLSVLMLFLVIKFGFLNKLANKLYELIGYALVQRNNRTLFMLVLKLSMKYGVRNPDLEKFERQILDALNSKQE